VKAVIEIVDDGIKAALAKMIDSGRSLRPAMRAIGGALVSSTTLRFRDSRSPDGSKWAPLSATTLMQRALAHGGKSPVRKSGANKGRLNKQAARAYASAKPLLDTGRLQNSITYAADANSVTVGTNVVYARMQQMGAKMGEFGRYSQLGRVRAFGLGTFKGSAGTKKGFPIPWGDVPPRPFLGLSTQDRADVIGILQQHLVPR